MSLGSSSSNHSLLPPSIGVSLPFGLSCLIIEPYRLILTIYTITNIIILLPLSILVLYYGLQRQQRRHSFLTATTTTNSDIFTYHLVTMKMVFVLGCMICCYGNYRKDLNMIILGLHLFSFTWYGETFFHVLTCVEHYLAVVHPVTYMSLKKDKWVRIRNIVIGFVWLLCICGSGLSALADPALVLLLGTVLLSLIIISFCCLSVLCALVRPRPGDQARVDQSKQRAFYIISAILAVLLVRCAWTLVWGMVYRWNSEVNECVVISGEVWFTLPSGLLLPLFFLQKTGIFRCFKTNITSK